MLHKDNGHLAKVLYKLILIHGSVLCCFWVSVWVMFLHVSVWDFSGFLEFLLSRQVGGLARCETECTCWHFINWLLIQEYQDRIKQQDKATEEY